MLAIDRVRLPAFALSEELGRGRGSPHHHRFHQVIYALRGALHLETAQGTWLLPPQRCALVPAGLEHLTWATRRVSLRTLYLAPSLLRTRADAVQVFAATPLAREMILHAMRWDHLRPAKDAQAAAFFRAFAGLVAELVEDTRDFHLPAAHSEELSRATAHVLAHLDRPLAIDAVARAAGSSSRTLTRRFAAELATTFRAYVRAARLLRAMDLLAGRARVIDVALAVGFESPSAFTAAFVEFVGETPRAYRARPPRL